MDHVIQMKITLGSEYLKYIKALSEEEKQVISDFLDIMVATINKKIEKKKYNIKISEI